MRSSPAMEIGCVCLKPIAQKTNRVLGVLERAGQSRLPCFNEVAAERLREAAILLAHQGDSPYRVAAYRRAADAVAALPSDLRELLDTGGIKALEEIPGVGSRIAGGPCGTGADRTMDLSGARSTSTRLSGSRSSIRPATSGISRHCS
jgi:hypothetical protein